MESLKKVFKIVGIICLFFLIFLGLFLAYGEYKKSEKKKSELTYETKRIWKWLDDYSDIQISKYIAIDGSKDTMLMLRKVYIDKNYSIYAYKDSNYELNAIAVFHVKCKPNSKILTTKKFSNKTNKELICDKDGESLSHSTTWNTTDNDVTWEENLDGFSFKEYFSNWDFTELDRYITLSKAK